ncbi:hypothetical protein RCL1_006314 [Eukaryota sp. TZLM3-RCL]
MSHLLYGYPLNFLLFSFFLCSFVFAQHFLLSRPLNLGDNFSNLRLSDVVHIIAVSDHRLLIFPGVRIDELMYFESFYILSHLEFISTGSSVMFLPFSHCFSRQDFSFNSLDFPKSNPSFVHLKAGLLSPVSEDIILIAFEFSSSNSSKQYDQLSLKVFSLLNLQESNTFEFIIENDLMSLYFNEFFLEQDQSIIANITITHNSDQCTTEFPHEVHLNSIISCSFCISNTGSTNTSSLQIIEKSIELQTNVVSYCSFLKKSVPLFLFVSDCKLVIRDVIQRRSLEIATPLSEVRSVDYISSTDSKSLFMVLICNGNGCDLRVVEVQFDLDEMKSDLNVVVLSAGLHHSAAVLADGTVRTWGSGADGRLGHGNTLNQLGPKTVDGITDAVSVFCGWYHTLVVRSNGQVLAFGSNSYGCLGDGTTSSRNSPVDVVDLSDVIAISAGHSHSIALISNGRVLSWGANLNGRLGRTPTTGSPSNRPGLVPNLIDVVTISAESDHNLAVRSDGSVASWGNGANGRLGNGGTSNSYQSIQNCGSFSSAVNVSAGGAHSLILLEGGDLWATGWNNYGQLGLGDTTQRNSPVRIDGFKFSAVAVRSDSNIGILTNGNVVVWGRNDLSQLGDGTTTHSSRPFVLEQLIGVYAFDIFWHTLVACRNGTVFGWGNNPSGQIGDGTTQTRSTPVSIIGLEI